MMLKFVPALALMLAAGPVLAQGMTQSPPSPNAGVSGPTPGTSVPSGATTANPSSSANPNVSGALGGSSTTGMPMTQPNAPTGPSGAMSNTVPRPQ